MNSDTAFFSSGGNWYKGSVHNHTTGSGGKATVVELAQWYRQHGMDFVVVTDHNVVTDLRLALPSKPDGAMAAELDKAEHMLADGGYVPGLDHLVPPNVSWNTWTTFNAELKKLIGV